MDRRADTRTYESMARATLPPSPILEGSAGLRVRLGVLSQEVKSLEHVLDELIALLAPVSEKEPPTVGAGLADGVPDEGTTEVNQQVYELTQAVLRLNARISITTKQLRL